MPCFACVAVLSPFAFDALVTVTEKDIRRLKFHFDDIDIDGSKEIDLYEFFEFVKETRSPLTDALFQLIDTSGNGLISFNEFVQVTVTYCMYNREEILKFVFDTYDADGSGAIDEEEFMVLCTSVNAAAPSFPGNFQRALEEFDSNDDGLIDFDEFRELNRRYPMILFPAFRLQDRMQRATLGPAKWAKILKTAAKDKSFEEYRRTHDGKLPKAAFGARCGNATFGKCCRCCKSRVAIYQEKTSRLKEKRKSREAAEQGVEEGVMG